jgi:ATP-dependent RNA helicase RhlE
VAISLCSDEERPYLRDIEKLTRQAVRQHPFRLDREREDRFRSQESRIESATVRDFRAPDARAEGDGYKRAGRPQTQRATARTSGAGSSTPGNRPSPRANRRPTPSSAAALPARRSDRVRSGPARG